MKHLFLKGPIRIGKSTLLRECLAPYRDRLSGFSVQRILPPGPGEDSSFPHGFRLVPAQDFCVQTSLPSRPPDAFLWRRGDRMESYPQVFETIGMELLREAEAGDLILLDEIGGMELLIPSFRHRLYQLLSGSLPCIGVVKAPSNLRQQQPALLAHNAKLHQDIEGRFDGTILTVSAETLVQVRTTVQAFLEK